MFLKNTIYQLAVRVNLFCFDLGFSFVLIHKREMGIAESDVIYNETLYFLFVGNILGYATGAEKGKMS